MKYSLGLDIGTTSIGWAVINEDKQRIEDLGVRIFERPENPENGESLAKPRRDARSTRRRLKRRRERLDYLKRFFIEHQLLSEKQIIDLLTYDKTHSHKDPYAIRRNAIKQKVPNDELFVALYHIAKRRGYKSNRKAIEEKDKENGKVLRAIKTNKPLLAQHDGSVATTLLEEAKFDKHKRNKAGEYNNSFIRADFESEVLAILRTQNWNQDWIDELLYANPNKDETRGKSGLFYQRPFMDETLINNMRGRCQFEDAPRAQKASYSFDLFRLAQDLAHLEYNDGEKLTPEEIKSCIEVFKEVKNPSYARIRKILGYEGDDSFHFDYIRGKRKDDKKENEKNVFGSMNFYHMVKTALKELPEDWLQIEQNTELLDQIGEILTLNKDDESLTKAFSALGLSTEVGDKLMTINVSGFCHLSIEALRKITPYMLEGNTYDKAVELAYPGKFTRKLSGSKNELPPLSEEQLHQLTNPVVKRAVSQTRKVINAIIKKYGAPYQIKIECARDLRKNKKERDEIKDRQDENAANNQRIVEKLEELGITNPAGQQIVKYKLREQQHGKCLYCGEPISLEIFTDEKLSEVDHIIPFSRCGIDRAYNKVLCCASCNQVKREKTPYEAWGNTAQWSMIIALANTVPEKKKNRILCEKPPKEDWRDHALKDTQYITKFLSNYIRSNLQFADYQDGRQQKVIRPAGGITDALRKMYGIGLKNRELNNCHHAVDACIIATVSEHQIAQLSQWHKYHILGLKAELEHRQYSPWENFAQEVRIRSGMTHDTGEIEKLSDFRDKFRQFKTYDEEFLQGIHPLFVSRMPKRSMKGQAHEETIRSPRVKDDGMRLCRKKLDKKFAENYIKNPAKSWLENSVLVESDKILYEQLKNLLREKGKNAFDEPVYKNDKSVDKNGRPLSPVHSIKVYEKKPDTSGTYLNNRTQFADNGKTICLNIYRRKNSKGEYKFFAAPLYVHSLNKKTIPILPTPNGRSKEEKAEFSKLRDANGLIMATTENGFELAAQVFPNDYLKITYVDRTVEGYYVGYDVSTGTGVISLIAHNQPQKKEIMRPSIGSATNFEFYNISVLGDNYKFE